MPSLNRLPWQQGLWGKLTARVANDTLPHGLLFYGANGLGKKQFVTEFMAFLLCHHPKAQQACGFCQSCTSLQSESHPDVIRVSAGDKKTISIDAIRELRERLQISVFYGKYRVVLIDDGPRLSMSASHGLLKMLEEPPKNHIYCLVAEAPCQLLATILSRCQRYEMPRPSRAEALQWLRQQGDWPQKQIDLALALSEVAPLKAKAILEDETYFPLIDCLAAGLNGGSLKSLAEVELSQLLNLCFDCLRLSLDAVGGEVAGLQRMPSYRSRQFWLFYDKLINISRMISKGLHLNENLWRGQLLTIWQQLGANHHG